MMTVRESEIEIWEAAKTKDAARFLQVVCEDAVMVCGGYRCDGKEYAGYISEFDCASYEIVVYETIYETEELAQNHYVVRVHTANPNDKDLAGIFHVTSTWKKCDQQWKLIYNMDSRIIE